MFDMMVLPDGRELDPQSPAYKLSGLNVVFESGDYWEEVRLGREARAEESRRKEASRVRAIADAAALRERKVDYGIEPTASALTAESGDKYFDTEFGKIPESALTDRKYADIFQDLYTGGGGGGTREPAAPVPEFPTGAPDWWGGDQAPTPAPAPAPSPAPAPAPTPQAPPNFMEDPAGYLERTMGSGWQDTLFGNNEMVPAVPFNPPQQQQGNTPLGSGRHGGEMRPQNEAERYVQKFNKGTAGYLPVAQMFGINSDTNTTSVSAPAPLAQALRAGGS